MGGDHMNLNLTPVAIAAGIVGTALLIGTTMGQEQAQADRDELRYRLDQATSQPTPTITVTVKAPPKTLPPKTVKVTVRVTERASRSNARSSVSPAKADSSGRPTGLWLELAKCESGANLTRNSGNGYYGAYQFSQSTWEGFLGTQYSPTPLGASWAEQTFIAYRIWLHPRQGWDNGFPGCGAKMGYPTMPEVAKP
jgi:hypothetical protein